MNKRKNSKLFTLARGDTGLEWLFCVLIEPVLCINARAWPNDNVLALLCCGWPCWRAWCACCCREWPPCDCVAHDGADEASGRVALGSAVVNDAIEWIFDKLEWFVGCVMVFTLNVSRHLFQFGEIVAKAFQIFIFRRWLIAMREKPRIILFFKDNKQEWKPWLILR